MPRGFSTLYVRENYFDSAAGFGFDFLTDRIIWVEKILIHAGASVVLVFPAAVVLDGPVAGAILMLFSTMSKAISSPLDNPNKSTKCLGITTRKLPF